MSEVLQLQYFVGRLNLWKKEKQEALLNGKSDRATCRGSKQDLSFTGLLFRMSYKWRSWICTDDPIAVSLSTKLIIFIIGALWHDVVHSYLPREPWTNQAGRSIFHQATQMISKIFLAIKPRGRGAAEGLCRCNFPSDIFGQTSTLF